MLRCLGGGDSAETSGVRRPECRKKEKTFGHAFQGTHTQARIISSLRLWFMKCRHANHPPSHAQAKPLAVLKTMCFIDCLVYKVVFNLQQSVAQAALGGSGDVGLIIICTILDTLFCAFDPLAFDRMVSSCRVDAHAAAPSCRRRPVIQRRRVLPLRAGRNVRPLAMYRG